MENYLEDNYELEDHRNDPAYEAWNQLAEQYEQNLAKTRGEIEVTKETGVRKMIAKEKLNILWSLEQTAEKYADRVAVSDVNQELTWKELVKKAQVIGAELSEKVQPGNPVPVLLEKSSETLAVMLGIVYAGCFYVPVNPMNPTERLRKIMEKLDPEVIISDEKGKEQLAAVGNGLENKVMGPEALTTATGTELSEEQYSRLEQIQGQWKETDVLYGIFTSGSTGTPKAIVVSHGAASRFIRHFTEIFEITSADVIGNQAPFDFDVSVKDIYSSIMTGAQLVLIPKEYFSTPPRLLDYLCDKKVTNLTWAVSALTLVSALKGLNYRVPESVKKGYVQRRSNAAKTAAYLAGKTA